MFHPIDLKKWPRAQVYHYFSQMAPTGYSITVNMDVTELKAAVAAGVLTNGPWWAKLNV